MMNTHSSSFKLLFILVAITALPASLFAQRNAADLKERMNTLWFEYPASQWEETLPLGNGRLGIMPDGGVTKERIVLNDINMWSGSEADYNNPEAAAYLPQIQQLLLEGKNKEAQEMMYKHFVPVKPEKGGTYGCFQMLANLDIEYTNSEKTQFYQRKLDLSNAISTTGFSNHEETNQSIREYFVSRTHDVAVIRIQNSLQRSVSFKATLNRPERAAVSSNKNTLILQGNLDSGKENTEGVAFRVEMSIVANTGNIIVSDNQIEVSNADEAIIIISAATNFNNPGYREEVARLLNTALTTPYQILREEHIASYQQLYNRAHLSVFPNEQLADPTELSMPTDERIRRFQEEDDPSLAALYYNYGRYLLINSTRPGSLPPNLQGLWANECGTPWNGDYHLNINVQMNHWPVEQGNLSELHLPLIELTKGLVKNGESTAKAFYGEKAQGWVAHMMTNVWNFTAPGEHPSWGATNTGGAWLCAHLWEHYMYTLDKEYLKEIYPVLKGAADFFFSTMIEEPTHGWLVTAPSSSPENSFYIGNDPTPVSVCMGTTMDNQLVRELYSNVIEAAHILNIDKTYSDQLRQACRKLPPHQISKEGYLMEWLEDYKETDIHHRHVSHLYGLHPGNQITLTQTPELAEACRATLNRRGDGGTGWSRAWKINFWARLGDGDRAYTLFKSLLEPAYEVATPQKRRGGTFPNLFCSHPPFQMDGNWGGTSGINEMLLQSHDGFINLLPALPNSWKKGTYTGFKVRGGASIDLIWENGRAQSATMTAAQAHAFKLKMPEGTSEVKIQSNGQTTSHTNKEYIDIRMEKDQKIELTFR